MENVENNEIKGVKKTKIKGNKKQETVFRESGLALLCHLSHHPHFVQSIAKIRNKYGIKVTDKGQDVLIWKNDHRAQYHKLVTDMMKLIADFSIPLQLGAAARHFALDCVFFNKQEIQLIFKTGFRVHKWTENQQSIHLNPSSIYLEITPSTSEREIRDNWEKIVGKRKESRKMGVSKVNRIDERVWELSELCNPKLNKEAMKNALKAEFGGIFTYDGINKRRFAYKRVLSKLRPI